MNSKKKILIIAVVFVLLLAGAFLLYNKLSGSVSPDQLAAEDEAQNQDEESDGQQAKVKAPDFVVYDKDGNKVGLSDYLGKPVVLNFWASWCGPCASEMPDFEEAYKERGDEIQFLMVNLTDGYQETMESATEYIQEQGFTFPVFYDTESNAANTYATYSIPMTFFIDSEGYMVARATGALDSKKNKKGLDMIE